MLWLPVWQRADEGHGEVKGTRPSPAAGKHTHARTRETQPLKHARNTPIQLTHANIECV